MERKRREHSSPPPAASSSEVFSGAGVADLEVIRTQIGPAMPPGVEIVSGAGVTKDSADVVDSVYKNLTRFMWIWRSNLSSLEEEDETEQHMRVVRHYRQKLESVLSNVTRATKEHNKHSVLHKPSKKLMR